MSRGQLLLPERGGYAMDVEEQKKREIECGQVEKCKRMEWAKATEKQRVGSMDASERGSVPSSTHSPPTAN
jgi:hypothetical protein